MTVLSSAAAAGAPDSHPQPAPAPAVPSGPSPGVGAWYGSRVDFLLGDSGASWYYTWAPHHDWITTPAGCEFVPMILGRQDVTAANLQSATTHGRTLLGLHQPDKKGKSSLSPSAALSLWPQLERSGLRLGAPAVTANAHRQGGWLDVFMSGGQARDEGWTSFLSTGIRVPRSSTPVTPTHPDMVSQVVAQHVHGRFGLPLWLTEFSLIAWGGGHEVADPSVQAEFLTAANSMMAGMPFVERWGWFSLTPSSGVEGASLYDGNNVVTPAGARFRTIAAVDTEPGPTPESTPTAAGVGAWYTKEVNTLLRDSGTSWYYTWAPHHDSITTPGGCEFVPMIWGKRDVTPTALQQAKANGTTLLAFNEPDEVWQSNSLTPTAALSAWPQLEATGLRLGAPAVATRGHAPGGWLDSFMSGLAKQQGRVDFIPLHWYSSPTLLTSSKNVVDAAVNELGQYLQAVHQRYGLPLWLTEFALVGWTANLQDNIVPAQSVQAEFLAAAASMMDGLSYVERWAWFSLTQYDMSPGASLYDADNKATLAGERFRSIAAEK